ncbi:MAG: ABC transporter permease [Pseudonocardiaceae bacterium]
MSLREAVLVALRGLRAHRLRSALTMLGLIIGVASVVLLAACGQGVSNSVDARIETIANNITIVPQASDLPDGPPAQNLTDADAAALHDAPDIATVTPAATATASIATDATTLLSSIIVGTSASWAQNNNRDFKAGSFFDTAQYSSGAKVVVRGPTVATTLFGGPAAALGQTVQINHGPFRSSG